MPLALLVMAPRLLMAISVSRFRSQLS